MDLEKVFSYIDDHREEMLQEVIRCASFRTVHGDEAGLGDCRNFLLSKMKELNLETDTYTSSYGVVLLSGITKGEKSKTLLMYNHYDVTPEGELSKWESDPYKPEVRNGALYCRGASDNKGTLMARLHALQAILAVGEEVPINLKFFFDGDEEYARNDNIGEMRRKSHDQFARWTHADYGLWEGGLRDSSGHIIATYGCRGDVPVKLEVNTANYDVHCRNGAIMPSAAWRMIWALSSLKNVNEEILIDGFYEGIESLGAADKKMLEALPYDEDGVKAEIGFKDYLLGLSGTNLKERMYLAPCINIAGFEAGQTHMGVRTIVPSKATAYLDIRLTSPQDPDQILQMLRNHLNKNGFEDIEVIPQNAAFPYPVRSRYDTSYTEKLISALNKVYPKPMKISPSMAGGGPQKPFRDEMPDLTMVGIGVSNPKSGNHSPNENIRIEDYFLAVKAFVSVFAELAEPGKAE